MRFLTADERGLTQMKQQAQQWRAARVNTPVWNSLVATNAERDFEPRMDANSRE